jgi:hypothetical protein
LPLERLAANLQFALVFRRYERGLDHRHLQPWLRAMHETPRRRHGRRRVPRPARPPRHHDHALSEALPASPTRARRRARRSGSAAPHLRSSCAVRVRAAHAQNLVLRGQTNVYPSRRRRKIARDATRCCWAKAAGIHQELPSAVTARPGRSERHIGARRASMRGQ